MVSNARVKSNKIRQTKLPLLSSFSMLCLVRRAACAVLCFFWNPNCQLSFILVLIWNVSCSAAGFSISFEQNVN